jgi:hypothetical protein
MSSHAMSSRVQNKLGWEPRPSDHLQVEFASLSYLTEDTMMETKLATNATVDALSVLVDQNVFSLGLYCAICQFMIKERCEDEDQPSLQTKILLCREDQQKCSIRLIPRSWSRASSCN